MEINFKCKTRKYRLTSDDNQFILSEKKKALTGKNKGQSVFYAVGYFSTIEGVLNKIINLEIQGSDAKSFPELLDAIIETRKMVGRLVSENPKTSK